LQLNFLSLLILPRRLYYLSLLCPKCKHRHQEYHHKTRLQIPHRLVSTEASASCSVRGNLKIRPIGVSKIHWFDVMWDWHFRSPCQRKIHASLDGVDGTFGKLVALRANQREDSKDSPTKGT
jgi:hypothetical protein